MPVNSKTKLRGAWFRGSGVEGVGVVGAGAEVPVGAVEAAAGTVRTVVGSMPWEARVRACLTRREATSFSAWSVSARARACRSCRSLESRASCLELLMACCVSHACSSGTDSSSSAGGVAATGRWAAVVSARSSGWP